MMCVLCQNGFFTETLMALRAGLIAVHLLPQLIVGPVLHRPRVVQRTMQLMAMYTRQFTSLKAG